MDQDRQKTEHELKETIKKLEKRLAASKQAEESLKQSKRLNELLLDTLPHPAMLIRRDRTILTANRIARETGAEVGGRCWCDFGHLEYIPEEHRCYFEEKGEMPPGGTMCNFCLADRSLDLNQPTNDPEVEAFGQLWDTWWIPIGDDVYLHYAINITERKQTENQLKKSLAEKEVLLKEVHHRVKNNLQIINSLLNLQSDRVEDEKSVAVIAEIKNRINSIALIHEKLHKSEDVKKIDFAAYLRTLLTHLFNTSPLKLSGVRLKLDLDDLSLEVDKAIPCALIINELFTNTLKYAFPNGKGGEAAVELRAGPGGNIALTVSDTGAGLPGDFDINAAQTLGMQIVRALAGQLNGTLQVDKRNGAAFTLAFKRGRPLSRRGTPDDHRDTEKSVHENNISTGNNTVQKKSPHEKKSSTKNSKEEKNE